MRDFSCLAMAALARRSWAFAVNGRLQPWYRRSVSSPVCPSVVLSDPSVRPLVLCDELLHSGHAEGQQVGLPEYGADLRKRALGAWKKLLALPYEAKQPHEGRVSIVGEPRCHWIWPGKSFILVFLKGLCHINVWLGHSHRRRVAHH